MKKFLTILLVTMMVVSVAACGGKSTDVTTTVEEVADVSSGETVNAADTSVSSGDTAVASTDEICSTDTSTAADAVSALPTDASNFEYVIEDSLVIDGDKRVRITGLSDTCTETEIVIPSTIEGYSVTYIGFYPKVASNITSVIIPDSVTTIGGCAFDSCINLTNVTIPSSVTVIGNQAFCSCTSLTNITIPDSVTTIQSFAFEYCSALTSITIPDSVTNIGYHVFRGCDNLTEIHVSSSNKAVINVLKQNYPEKLVLD